MPNKNEKTKKEASQNHPPDEIDDNENGEESTDSKKGFLSSTIDIFKHLFPALKEAFASGAKTFKRRVQGITEPEQSGEEDEEEEQKYSRPNDGQPEAEGEEESLPQHQAGSFKAKLAAASKKQKFLLAFLIASIIILPVLGGLYLGGIFDEDGAAAEKGKPASAASQEAVRKGSLFDSIFGKKNQPPATPAEQLAAMHITINPNNFVKHAGQNDIPVVQLFIQSGMRPDTRRPIDGATPLTAAASFGRLEMAQFLLDDNGADINAKDNDGQTALMKAARHNRPEMAELLLKRNADYNIADKQGNTALSLANEHYGDNPLTKVFEKFGIDISAAKKEPVKNEKNESELINSVVDSEAAPAQPRQSRHPEISVHEFLKSLQPANKQ